MTRFEFDPERSRVWIEGESSVHPVRAAADGVTGWFEADLEDGLVDPTGPVAGRIEIAVDRLASGNPLLDRETRRRIDARRHPHIVGELTAVEQAEAGRVRLRGVVHARGKSREVTGAVGVTAAGPGEVVLEGEQTFDVRDWGLDPPRLFMLRVHPEVRVRIRVEATAVP